MKNFLNCKIDASRKVFRPRVETEFWVKKAIKIVQLNNYPTGQLQVLDIFSGTGCIGISLLKACPETVQRVDFVDIWPDAIKQIKINLKLNKIKKNKVRVYKSNLFEKLKGKKYDFIFANPPYVALDRISEVQKEVLEKDPPVALFAGKDGTVLVEKFFQEVKDYLKSEGTIFLEFDPLQKNKIKRILKKKKFKAFFKEDQFKKSRWLKAI